MSGYHYRSNVIYLIFFDLVSLERERKKRERERESGSLLIFDEHLICYASIISFISSCPSAPTPHLQGSKSCVIIFDVYPVAARAIQILIKIAFSRFFLLSLFFFRSFSPSFSIYVFLSLFSFSFLDLRAGYI
jgi:hypothetical protein